MTPSHSWFLSFTGRSTQSLDAQAWKREFRCEKHFERCSERCANSMRSTRFLSSVKSALAGKREATFAHNRQKSEFGVCLATSGQKHCCDVSGECLLLGGMQRLATASQQVHRLLVELKRFSNRSPAKCRAWHRSTAVLSLAVCVAVPSPAVPSRLQGRSLPKSIQEPIACAAIQNTMQLIRFQHLRSSGHSPTCTSFFNLVPPCVASLHSFQ